MDNSPALFPFLPAGHAVISPDNLYRYELTRSWGTGDPPLRRAVFCMLNPSRADASVTDPTLTRCLDYAKTWGFDSLTLVNLFAFRSTDPAGLRSAADPVGPENDNYIREWAGRADLFLVAWGAHPFAARRVADVMRIVADAGAVPHYLKLTKDGHPGHPLMLPKKLTPIPMEVIHRA